MECREFDGKEVTIMACSDCNIRCKHCYIGYQGGFDSEVLFSLCKHLKEKYRIILNGTELLLHPEYFACMKYIGQESIITNGIELAKKPELLSMMLEAGIKYVGISYHMYIHSDISVVDPKLIEKIFRELKKENIITEVRVTITSQNYDKIREICQKAKEMQADGIKFTNYMHMGNALQLDTRNILSDEEVTRCLDDIEKVRGIYPKEVFLIRRCGSFGNSKYGRFHCPAGKESVVVTPDLKVYPCFFLIQEGLEIGHVENGKVWIERNIEHDGSKCLAQELNNKKMRHS